MEIWTTRADVVQSYGQSFDELVDLVANAMAATGYHSKHASSREGDRPPTASLADSVIGLGFLCAKIEKALSGPLRPGRSEFLVKAFSQSTLRSPPRDGCHSNPDAFGWQPPHARYRRQKSAWTDWLADRHVLSQG